MGSGCGNQPAGRERAHRRKDVAWQQVVVQEPASAALRDAYEYEVHTQIQPSRFDGDGGSDDLHYDRCWRSRPCDEPEAARSPDRWQFTRSVTARAATSIRVVSNASRDPPQFCCPAASQCRSASGTGADRHQVPGEGSRPSRQHAAEIRADLQRPKRDRGGERSPRGVCQVAVIMSHPGAGLTARRVRAAQSSSRKCPPSRRRSEASLRWTASHLCKFTWAVQTHIAFRPR
jgi:hypothetical protein